MTVLSPRSTTADLVRGVTLVVLAVAQIVVSGIGGSGAAGESVGVVARDYPTPLLAAGWAFSIWALVYAGFLALAVYQLLPAQRSRGVHRDTGWWLVGAGVLNPAWILAFANRWIPLAQLLIIALLVCLAVVFGRLARVPAQGVVERIVVRGTVALYTGWVSLATVLGAAATGVWVGLPGDGPLADLAAIVILVAVAVIASGVVTAATGVLGYTAAVVWALAGIVAEGPSVAVAVTAAAVALVVLVTTLRRVGAAASPARAAWG